MATIQIQNTQGSIVDALWTLIQSQPKMVKQAIASKFKEEDFEMENQKSLVKDALTQSLKELKLAQEGKIRLEGARDLFK